MDPDANSLTQKMDPVKGGRSLCPSSSPEASDPPNGSMKTTKIRTAKTAMSALPKSSISIGSFAQYQSRICRLLNRKEAPL